MYSSIRYESPHTRNGVAVLYTTHTNCRLISTTTATIENHYNHRNMFLLLLKALAIPNQAQDLLYSMPCICNICFIYCFFFEIFSRTCGKPTLHIISTFNTTLFPLHLPPFKFAPMRWRRHHTWRIDNISAFIPFDGWIKAFSVWFIFGFFPASHGVVCIISLEIFHLAVTATHLAVWQSTHLPDVFYHLCWSQSDTQYTNMLSKTRLLSTT